MALESVSSVAAQPEPRIQAAGSPPDANLAPPPAAAAAGDVVSLSDEARAALAVGDALRERMNARDEAGSAGAALFSDDELARITLNRDGFFSDDQAAEASGALDARLARSLAPHEGDPRARAMAINALHAQMSDDTRAALKWSAALIDANRATLREDSARSGWLDNRPIIAGLDHAAGKGGLDFSSMNFNWLESYPDPPWLDYPFNDGVSRFSSDRTRALSHYPAPPGQAPSRTDRLA